MHLLAQRVRRRRNQYLKSSIKASGKSNCRNESISVAAKHTDDTQLRWRLQKRTVVSRAAKKRMLGTRLSFEIGNHRQRRWPRAGHAHRCASTATLA